MPHVMECEPCMAACNVDTNEDGKVTGDDITPECKATVVVCPRGTPSHPLEDPLAGWELSPQPPLPPTTNP